MDILSFTHIYTDTPTYMYSYSEPQDQFLCFYILSYQHRKTIYTYNEANLPSFLSFLCLQAVKGTMQRTCKCHGVSGSCTTQTCWLQLPEFREVGNYLKEKYHRALKVDLLRGAGNSAASRGAIAETFSSISRKELVHLEDSPDYCLENRTLGLPGTEGRECLKKGKSLSKWEKRSCKRLCGECGLAVEERKAEMVSSCNCKFHWCCTVKCEQCRKTVTKYFCVKKGGQRGRNESAGSRRKNLRLRKKH